MSAIENDPSRYDRMADRAAASTAPRSDRENWPVPAEVRGASARDAFLWYVADGWRKIFGEGEPVETLFDNDFGLHVLRKGSWQLSLVNTEQFPDSAWPADEGQR